MIMNNVRNSCNNEDQETNRIISSLLTGMIMKVLLIRQQHLEKLSRDKNEEFFIKL